jgi:hypothetical protein
LARVWFLTFRQDVCGRSLFWVGVYIDVLLISTSQLSRLFIYENLLVKPTDIVITVDVNLFVTASHILEPIDKFPHRRAWIFQYEDTAYIDYGWGETFNQVIIIFLRQWQLLDLHGFGF